MRGVDPAKVMRAKEMRREMTGAERTLWQRLRTDQLHGLHFYRQKILHGFIVDFYCPAANLVVEVDGGIHQHQAAYDAERDTVLSGAELTVLRVTNEDVHGDVSTVLERITALCRRAIVQQPEDKHS